MGWLSFSELSSFPPVSWLMFVNYLFNFKVCNVRYGQLIFFLQKKLALTIREGGREEEGMWGEEVQKGEEGWSKEEETEERRDPENLTVQTRHLPSSSEKNERHTCV